MNSDILDALNTMLSESDIGQPIAWPGVDFTPPAAGAWLEVQFFPNRGIDNGISYADQSVPQGIYQVSVIARKGYGMASIMSIADDVMDAFARGEIITGSVRIGRNPYCMTPIIADNRLEVPVTIEYTG